MDVESLAQIEQIVSRAEVRLRNDFGEKTEALAATLRQEIGAKTGELGTTLRQEIGAKTGELGTTLRQEIAERSEKLGERIEEVKRYSGVLYEDMSRKLDFVIEGFEGVRQGNAALRQMIQHESLEMQSLMKLSYRQLQERVESLEQRVQLIEKRVGLST